MTTPINPPDPKQIADWVAADIAADHPQRAQGELDAIGTLTGLTENDLIEVIIELAHRIAEHGDG